MARPRHSSLAGRRARALRNEMTVSEARVWKAIRSGKTGARFRRQVPIGYWIADFASFHPRVVVEIDDKSHEWRDEERRTRYFEAQGFSVLRFSNEDVAKELPSVASTIERVIRELAPLPGFAGTPPNVGR